MGAERQPRGSGRPGSAQEIDGCGHASQGKHASPVENRSREARALPACIEARGGVCAAIDFIRCLGGVCAANHLYPLPGGVNTARERVPSLAGRPVSSLALPRDIFVRCNRIVSLTVS
jgi:hypothetical protein